MQLTFSLPDEAELIIDIGKTVKIGDSLYKIQKKEIVIVSFARDLGIKPDDIFSSLTKNISDAVTKGDILGQKKTLLSLKTSISPVNGVLAKIDHEAGTVHINTSSSQSQNFTAFFNGEIVAFDKKTDLLTIEIAGMENYSLKSASPFGGGKISILTQKDFFTIEEEDVKDHIVIIENLTSQIDAKFDALGALGAIFLQGEGDKLDYDAQLESEPDFKKLASTKEKFIAFSLHDKKAVVYS